MWVLQPLCLLSSSTLQVRDFSRDWRSGETLYSLVRFFVGAALPRLAPEQVCFEILIWVPSFPLTSFPPPQSRKAGCAWPLMRHKTDSAPRS